VKSRTQEPELNPESREYAQVLISQSTRLVNRVEFSAYAPAGFTKRQQHQGKRRDKEMKGKAVQTAHREGH
jgi:hypothetical protein